MQIRIFFPTHFAYGRSIPMYGSFTSLLFITFICRRRRTGLSLNELFQLPTIIINIICENSGLWPFVIDQKINKLKIFCKCHLILAIFIDFLRKDKHAEGGIGLSFKRSEPSVVAEGWSERAGRAKLKLSPLL